MLRFGGAYFSGVSRGLRLKLRAEFKFNWVGFQSCAAAGDWVPAHLIVL